MNFIDMETDERAVYGVAIATIGLAMMNSACGDKTLVDINLKFARYCSNVLGEAGGSLGISPERFSEITGALRKKLEDVDDNLFKKK